MREKKKREFRGFLDFHSLFSHSFLYSALTLSVTRQQRLDAIHTALEAFSTHKHTQLHNYEVDCGAANALCLKLGYIQNNDWNEIDLILATLLCVYKGCTQDRLLRSFHDIGHSELMPLLTQTLYRLTSALVESVLLRVVLLLRLFAKLDVTKTSLIQTNGLIENLIKLLQQTKESTEIQGEMLGFIKDLTFRSSSRDREILFHTPMLVPTLVQLTTTTTTTTSYKSDYNYVANIWWNFALLPLLTHTMMQSEGILESLQSLLTSETSKVRRSALSALGNLASQQNATTHLIPRFREVLQSIVVKDNDKDCQRRAMRTIRCLVDAFRQQEGFLDFLCKVIVADTSDIDTMMHAVECMTCLTSQPESKTQLIAILIFAVEVATVPRMTTAACRTILSIPDRPQLSDRISCEFLVSLEKAVKETKEYDCHDIVSKILLILSTEDNEKLLSTPVLNILAMLALSTGTIIQVIQNIAEKDANRRPMAEHDALLSSLVTFAMETNDGPEKDNAKNLILKLVTEL